MQDNTDTSYAFRLLPGEDLDLTIENFLLEQQVQAGWIVSCTGSLTTYSIRFANQAVASTGTGYFEIVSLTGTVSVNGSHLHIIISDGSGKTIGGHLLKGCTIFTTAEIILVESGKYIFTREEDGSTPWKELNIAKRQAG